MKYKISKKLFEQVTGYEGTIHEYNRECIINGDVEEHISINDFFFMCKEWAYNQGYDMLSGGLEAGLHSCYIDYSDKRYTLSMKPINHFFAESEQQAVFDACMYILDIKKEG